MKKIFYLLLAILFSISCSKKQNSVDEDLTQQTFSFNGGETFNYKVNLISTDSIPFDSENIQAEIDGKTLEINKIDETTWGYAIIGTPNSSIDVTFTIDKDSYIITHQIKEIVLESTPKVISENLFNQIETAKNEITNPNTSSEISKISNVFDDLWIKASNQEKKEFAEFYSVNKQLFDDLINISTSENKSISNKLNKTLISDSNKYALKFGLSVYTLGTSVQLGIRSLGNPLAATAFAAAAVISFNVAVDTWVTYSNLKLEIIDFDIEEEFESKSSLKVKTTNYTQNENTTKFYELNINTKNISENSKSPILARVWNNYKNLKGITESINSVIDFVNDYNPFSTIPSLEYPNPPPVLTEKRPLNSEDYKNLTISKGNDNLNQTESFSNGGINLKFSKKENIEYEKTKISASVGVNLNSDYGNANTSFPITVLLKDCNDDYGGEAYTAEECDVCVGGNTGKTEEEVCKENPFIGNWTAINFNGGKIMGELQKSGFISECNLYTEQWTLNSASANITENNLSMSISQKTGLSSYSSEGGLVDCESFKIEFENDNFTINDSYTIKSNGSNADLDTEIDCEGEGNNISTLSISGNKLIFKYCELTLTFEK